MCRHELVEAHRFLPGIDSKAEMLEHFVFFLHGLLGLCELVVRKVEGHFGAEQDGSAGCGGDLA